MIHRTPKRPLQGLFYPEEVELMERCLQSQSASKLWIRRVIQAFNRVDPTSPINNSAGCACDAHKRALWLEVFKQEAPYWLERHRELVEK